MGKTYGNEGQREANFLEAKSLSQRWLLEERVNRAKIDQTWMIIDQAAVARSDSWFDGSNIRSLKRQRREELR